MSAATSPGTGLAYGLRRVCAAWGMARSSFYAMTSGQHAEQPPAKRQGPKPAISDQALLVAIEADLEASPWEGEGYRKVWARLRVCRDIRVARKFKQGIAAVGILSTQQLAAMKFEKPAALARYNGGLIVRDSNGDGALDPNVDQIIGGVIGKAPAGAKGQEWRSLIVHGALDLSRPTRQARFIAAPARPLAVPSACCSSARGTSPASIARRSRCSAIRTICRARTARPTPTRSW